MSHGTILKKGALILRNDVGSATTPSGGAYELTTTMLSVPLVKSETTGKTWAIDWDALIALAVAEGVDEE